MKNVHIRYKALRLSFLCYEIVLLVVLLLLVVLIRARCMHTLEYDGWSTTSSYAYSSSTTTSYA